MKLALIFTLGIAALTSVPVLAEVAPTTAVAAAAPIAPAVQSRNDPNRVICREEEELGSRVHKRRTCLTSAQWRELASQTGRDVDQHTAQGGRNGGG
jgi:hypothetical protein